METMPIHWHLHLNTDIMQLYRFLDSDLGRSRFWAESAVEKHGSIHFIFPNSQTFVGRILERVPSQRFKLVYYGGSITTFDLVPDGAGGTDLTLTNESISPEDFNEVNAGWVSVLLALKAALDFGIDLRNHDPGLTWDQGYVDN